MKTKFAGCVAVLGFCGFAALAATITVPAGGDFQGALNSARAGDVIMLAAGATYKGPFELPPNPGSAYITIRTNAADNSLPGPGVRMTPAYSALLPKLVADWTEHLPVIRTVQGSNHYQFIGIEISPTAGTSLLQLVQLGDGSETSLSQLPEGFIIDRCYLHGDPALGTRRGVAMNAPNITVTNSYLSDFKIVGPDSQALASWNGPGPLTITNNYLEGAGENILIGGQDPTIAGLVPTGITIRRNHFSKPLSWRQGDHSYQGTHWTVKNLLEFKNACQIIVDGNLFENNWADAQSGFAILFTPRNQDGGAPWSGVSNARFTNNILRHVASGISILGTDDINTSQPLHDITISNNLFEDVTSQWGGTGRLLQLLNGATNVTVDHNTGLPGGAVLIADQLPSPGFHFTNNLADHGDYGFFGSGIAEGTATLAAYFPNSVFLGNAIIGGNAELYPRGNFFPAGIANAGFTDSGNGDYSLLNSSPLHNAATDGGDVGADKHTLNAAQSGDGASKSGDSPSIGLSPSSLQFSSRQSDGNHASQTIRVTNSGTGTLNWSASVTSGDFLSLGGGAGSNSGVITASVKPANLASGIYTANIRITADGATNSPQDVAVTLEVVGPPQLIVLGSQSVRFVATAGAASPPTQTVSISNGHGGALISSTLAVTNTGPNWLQVTGGSGSTTRPPIISVNTSGMTAGNYTGKVIVSAPDASNSPQVIAVSLTVSQRAPLAALAPSGLLFTAGEIGMAPQSKSFVVENLGAGSMGFTATVATTGGGSWLSISAASGVAPTTITVTAAPGNLKSGGYNGTVTITPLPGAGAANGPLVLPVGLSINAPAIVPGGVVSAATFNTSVTGGSIVSLFGVDLSGSSDYATVAPLPTTLARTQVMANGIAAPLFYVSPSQINLQLPTGLSGTITITVVSDTTTGVSTHLNLVAEAPGIFTLRGAQGAVVNQDFSINSANSRAQAGSVIQIYATGLGATNPPLAAGRPGNSNPPFNLTVNPVKVFINGQDAIVQFSGAAPGLAGLFQINAVVPALPAASESVPLQIEVNGNLSNIVTMAVKP